jgi:hypothetical protein
MLFKKLFKKKKAIIYGKCICGSWITIQKKDWGTYSCYICEKEIKLWLYKKKEKFNFFHPKTWFKTAYIQYICSANNGSWYETILPKELWGK